MSYNNTTSSTKIKADAVTLHVHGLLMDYTTPADIKSAQTDFHILEMEMNENQELPGKYGNTFNHAALISDHR